jgi:Zn-dependent protease
VILALVAFLASTVVHEGSHALMATALGDDTPRKSGQLTLNPLKHIDPFGFLMFALLGFGILGRTPFNPSKLRPNPRTGTALVAVAGPASNLVLAILAGALLKSGWATTPELLRFLQIAASINVILFVLNLLPIPGLDGFSALVNLVPGALVPSLRGLERYGMMPLFLILFLLPLIGLNPIGWVLGSLASPLDRLIWR